MSDPINPLAPSQPAPSDHPMWQEFHKWALKRLGAQNHVLHWEAFLLGFKLGSQAAIDSMKTIIAAQVKYEREKNSPPQQGYGASSDSDFDAE